ncbi:hypothetical protein O181_015334 [Austropuccinia psidii MF-1]|uniref:Uncharacterized protein n=1 Tax=Austropuccinia psidii MF-1 TaxID=1389203 RepID=A0A9Q3BZS9_9BASI|nr:hypothetical protein [Austropuccinia psidii MF-1]
MNRNTQSPPSQSIPTTNNLLDPMIVTELQNSVLHKDEVISQLLNRVQAMELQIQNHTSTKKKAHSKKGTSTRNTSYHFSKNQGEKEHSQFQSPKSRSFSLDQKAKIRKIVRKKNSDSSSRKSPLQMVGNDYPAGYEHTKDAFYIHIKLLWGLIEKNAVPSAPDPSQLNEFYQRFSTPDQIESALANNGPALVPVDTVQTLRNARQKRTKVGKYFIHLSEFSIIYVRSSLSKLGIRTWAPNLYEQPDSLYNEACRISALKTFRQLVVGGTYQFMNVNQSYINDLGLLTKSYDHYVHFYFYNIFNKEQVENGKHRKDNDRRALQESRTKLRDLRYRFAISQNFPKRYIRVLKPIQAHSDEEYVESKEVYVVRKLPFRSQSANTFIRKLDEAIKKTHAADGRHSKRRHRIRIKNPPITLFPKAPKGLPLDFYDVEWFNSKLPAQRKNLADVGSIAFLRDPTASLEFKSPDEKMGDSKFTDKNWDDATKDYDLNFLVSVEYDSDDESSEGTESDYGESIEMETSDEEEEEYGNPNNENDKMESVKGKARETYSEYDEDEEAMEIETSGRAGYYGGLTEEEWDQWQ